MCRTLDYRTSPYHTSRRHAHGLDLQVLPLLLELALYFHERRLLVAVNEMADQMFAYPEPRGYGRLLLAVLEVRAHDILNLLGLELVQLPLLLALRSDRVRPTDIHGALLIILFPLPLLVHNVLLCPLRLFPYRATIYGFQLSFQVLGLLFKPFPDGYCPPCPPMELCITYPILVQSEIVVVPRECLRVEDVGGGHPIDLSELRRMPPIFYQIIGQHEDILLGLGLILQRTYTSPPHAVIVLPYLLVFGLLSPSFPPAPAIAPWPLLSRVGIDPKVWPYLAKSSLHIAEFSRIL